MSRKKLSYKAQFGYKARRFSFGFIGVQKNRPTRR